MLVIRLASRLDSARLLGGGKWPLSGKSVLGIRVCEVAMVTRRVSEDKPDTSSLTRRVSIKFTTTEVAGDWEMSLGDNYNRQPGPQQNNQARGKGTWSVIRTS